MSVVVETTIGDFTVDLYTDQRPQTCRNFLKLCKVKYYNWSLFHTVQSNFIAQTGDPTGTGKGGESIYGTLLGKEARYYEAEQRPKIKHDRVGLLSMVNCGENMLGSQFFITLDRDLQSLDGEHCVFGEIVEGLEIILKFNETHCDDDDRPFQDIRISHTVILEDPFEDPKTLVVPDRSPEPTREFLESDRIGADESLDDTAGMTAEEKVEIEKANEARHRATVLEIVGDIPDADMAPPENVLFVCKLNPVTNDDDLEIIFCRFGKIVGCEVIRDRQTGDSLQYAFIEFADRKSCEDAYFKMDNVLIDDRRIHVDFSQSVSKMRWRGKGKGIMYNDDKREDGGRKRKDEFDERGSGDRRRNNNQREGRNNGGIREKVHDDRQRSDKFEKRRDNDNYRREPEERHGKRRENKHEEKRRDADKYDEKRRDQDEYDEKRRDHDKYDQKRRDHDKYDEKRRDYDKYVEKRRINDKHDEKRRDADKYGEKGRVNDRENGKYRREVEDRHEKRRDNKYSEKGRGNDRGRDERNRSESRSRSRSREKRGSDSTDRRPKRRDDEKRRQYDTREEKSSRSRHKEKRSRDRSEERLKKKAKRHEYTSK